jgi:predicted naringenin-chalcone synthase
MGCHAGLIGLRNAKAIVEADPEAVVLMVNVELCSLHLQQTSRLDRLVSFLLFADGCSASLISARPHGLRLDECASHLSLADSERMAWRIEDSGFAMTLDVRLPERIRTWFQETDALSGNGEIDPARTLWAIHPGGRSILDSVQEVCGISDEGMRPSREVLRRYGNMSSASILFVLRELLHGVAPAHPSRSPSGHGREGESSAGVSSPEPHSPSSLGHPPLASPLDDLHLPGAFPEAVDEDCPGRAMAFGPGLTVETALMTLKRNA